MSFDAQAFASGEGNGDGPPDGQLVATLERCSIVAQKNDQNKRNLKCEWHGTEPPYYYWTTWTPMQGGQMRAAREMVVAFGVDLTTQPTESQLAQLLVNAEHRNYDLNITHRGDFTNVEVLGLASDVPADVGEAVTQRAEQAGGLFADDDVPF